MPRLIAARLARILALSAVGLGVLCSLLPASARAQSVPCPNPVPVVDENRCRGAGSDGWRLNNAAETVIAGFSTETSYNRGQDVPLKIARNLASPGSTRVNIAVYRMGYYGGAGGRLVHSRNDVAVNNDFTCRPENPVTGKYDCGNWLVTYTIPASALPASGVYLVKLTTRDTLQQNSIVFVVRDDNRTTESQLLVAIPTATYQAYNNFGGKSLYFDADGGLATVAGTPRAVKVSFNRPLSNPEGDRDRFLGPDFALVQWLEQQGYDASYTEDVAIHRNPAELKQHDALVITGHSEYWSLEHFNAVKAARDAGVHIASFSANTAYWKVRYEDSGNTLVCYKTVQGDGSGGSGSVSANDWGPDGIEATSDDALGLDQIAGTSDDRPENSTTTFRDNGAPAGDPNAPPGGRVGPDMPENQLFGILYVGDNDSKNYPLQVPAANANGEFSGDRIWRNTGVPTNTLTNIGTDLVGWEWDAIPAQAQYLSRQPVGVKRLSDSNVASTADDPSSWLLDEGRQRSSQPPPGQPSSVQAVKYTAPSGALVFASGTMHWSLGLSHMADSRIQQASYNVLSDMTVQPNTPSGVTLDPAGSNRPPSASFTATPNPVQRGNTVTFDASASSDTDGTIARYEWDLDGNGTFETDTGTVATASRLYPDEATLDIRLRVTDNGGASDITVRTLFVIGNRPPSAALAISPNPAVAGQTVTFDGAASADPDGTVVKYEWDLDGNGTYELDTGSTSSTTRSYETPVSFNAGLRVTDNEGKTGTASVPFSVKAGGVSAYPDAVLDTPGLLHYWRLGEASGTTLADAKGSRPLSQTGATLGVPGAVAGDPNTAASFDGISSFASGALDLTATRTITVEFWLNWDAYQDDDRLALEFTPNFNQNEGGFLVDPNAPQGLGSFGVAIGSGGARNNAFFARPKAGAWHHYAFVLDTTASPAQQITPYVDGKPVTYTKTESGSGGPGFAASNLYVMSRAGSALFGWGDMDELAIYGRALTPSEVAEHYESYGTNRRPVSAFTMTPNPVKVGTGVQFDGSSSSDPDGTITRYEWDLDGDGTFELDSGGDPTVARGYSAEGDVNVRLRVTDQGFGTDVHSQTLKVGNQPPTAAFTVDPNPSIVDLPVTFDAASSVDLDGTITRLEWDLDGNGSYETDTGTTRTVTRTYTAPGTLTIGLRVTDDEGKLGTVAVPVTVNSGGVSQYGDAVLDTNGLIAYWRMGEATGTTFADSRGSQHASATNVQLGAAGAVAGDPNTAARFNGTTSFGAVPLNLSGLNAITVELWLKWDRYRNEDRLALEFTDNFNGSDGGFIVDPDAPQLGGKFGVGIGRFASRNNVFFDRPSAGAWHHYAFVLDTTAPAASQITPYVDGRAVPYSKLDSGSGAGNFANAVLYMMSRGGTALFGAGEMDELAIYDRPLSAARIAEHYASYGTNRRPSATFTISKNPIKRNQNVTFDATGSSDPDGSITKHQWDLDGNGSYETDTGTNPKVSRSYASEATMEIKLRVLDNQRGTDVATRTLVVGSQPPVASFTATPNPAVVGQSVAFNASGSSDVDGTIQRYEWDLDGNGTYETNTGTAATTSRTYATPGDVAVGLRVTDDDGKTGTATRTVGIKTATYANGVLATAGLRHYWRLDETTGTTLADAKGSSPATAAGGVTLGVPGAPAGSSLPAARFDGIDDFARAAVNLSATQKVTIEFWLKWDRYFDDDDLAMELTSNFNLADGGLLVDPNSFAGTFAVAIGRDASRNSVFFARPSAGEWHHYALVLDSSAPAESQITPYVDGVPVPYTKGNSGTGAGPFASADLYFMARAGGSLFGAGDLDELAVYDTALSAATIAEHYDNGTP